MSSDLLIGIDAGTSVVKALAFDTDGRQLASASRPNSYRVLQNGGVEQNMSRTWDDAIGVVSDLAAQVENLADRVVALAVTGQGDGTWLIDADGKPVHDGWLWLDARAASEAGSLAACEGIDVVYRHTGTGVNLCQMRTHLRWMQRHDPALLERAAAALHCKDWLYYRFTGVLVSDPSEGVFTFGDIRTRDYSEEVIAALGLSALRRLLPPIVDGSREAHLLTAEAARVTGLPEGLPVVLGYVDIACSAMGSGLYDPELRPGLSVLGSTGVHMRFVPDAESVVLNAERSGYTIVLPDGACAQMQTNMVATINLDWLLDVGCELLACQGLTRTRLDLLHGIDEQVLEARPGAAIYHPYISSAGERGPFMEPRARASFTGLERTVGWIDLIRAVYDGLAMAARDCHVAMGPVPAEIRLAGGAARSFAMRKILAAALGTPVRPLRQEETGAVGAVMLAAVQQGHFSDLTACSEAWLKPRLEDPVQPDPCLVSTYDTMFEAFLETRQAMSNVWAAQTRMRNVMS